MFSICFQEFALAELFLLQVEVDANVETLQGK